MRYIITNPSSSKADINGNGIVLLCGNTQEFLEADAIWLMHTYQFLTMERKEGTMLFRDNQPWITEEEYEKEKIEETSPAPVVETLVVTPPTLNVDTPPEIPVIPIESSTPEVVDTTPLDATRVNEVSVSSDTVKTADTISKPLGAFYTNKKIVNKKIIKRR